MKKMERGVGEWAGCIERSGSESARKEGGDDGFKVGGWGEGGAQDIKAQAGVGWSHIKSQKTKGGEDNDHRGS